ncbi:MAG: signal peptidase I [Tannerellaceae bacterium]|nr:signal peptidase I [Tannerellaceae bacterium]
MKVKAILNRLLHLLVNIAYWSSIIILIFLTSQIFFAATFKIPSDSMTPGIIAGDNVMVWKPAIGARLFNIFSAAEGEQVKIYRLPGYRKIRRNDVLVFNYPYPNHGGKIEMHLLKYYIKRCVALPGDTFYIDNGFYKVKGRPDTLGASLRQGELALAPDSAFSPELFNCFSPNAAQQWTMKNFGPIYIPRKGSLVSVDTANISIYKNLIEYETGKAVESKDGNVTMDNATLVSYTFTKNYYFMAGDEVLNSRDSRYWGLLPEDHIVGKAAFIWKSKDPHTGKYRWERLFKAVR